MGYRTKQREILLSFFEAHHDQSFCVEEIAQALGQEGISVSAIYRNIAELEKEKRLSKSFRSGSHVAYYQLIDCVHCRGHIHMRCVECGKTTHLNEESASRLLSGVLSSSNFSIDPNTTVLYGLCGDCASHHGGDHQ